jgi:hypothetical protein
VEETIVGMGEGDVGEVSDFTSSFYCACAVPKCVAMVEFIALFRHRLMDVF